MNLLKHQPWGRNELPGGRGAAAAGLPAPRGGSQGPWEGAAKSSQQVLHFIGEV